MPSTWNIRVSWSKGLGAGKVLNAGDMTFYPDGTWGYGDGGGRWVQVGGHVFWNFRHPRAAGLVYSANIQWASMTGIMGYTQGFNKGSFYALRLGLPGGQGGGGGTVGPEGGPVGGPPEATPPEPNTDPMLGPVDDPLLGSVD